MLQELARAWVLFTQEGCRRAECPSWSIMAIWKTSPRCCSDLACSMRVQDKPALVLVSGISTTVDQMGGARTKSDAHFYL